MTTNSVVHEIVNVAINGPCQMDFYNGYGYVPNQNSDTVTVFDTRNWQVVEVITLSNNYPIQVRFKGNLGYVANASYPWSVTVFDPSTNNVVETISDLSNSGTPYSLGFVGDSGYVANFDASTITQFSLTDGVIDTFDIGGVDCTWIATRETTVYAVSNGNNEVIIFDTLTNDFTTVEDPDSTLSTPFMMVIPSNSKTAFKGSSLFWSHKP